MSEWHASVADELALPKLYDLDDVAAAFDAAGFDVSVAALELRFVPVTGDHGGHEHRKGLANWLDYYRRDKVMFRFARPA